MKLPNPYEKFVPSLKFVVVQVLAPFEEPNIDRFDKIRASASVRRAIAAWYYSKH